jgi:hypothetical protein
MKRVLQEYTFGPLSGADEYTLSTAVMTEYGLYMPYYHPIMCRPPNLTRTI